MIVDYCGEQFIVELKIWRGNEYHQRGERQIADYLDFYHQKEGYLISFNFNQKKETGVKGDSDWRKNDYRSSCVAL